MEIRPGPAQHIPVPSLQTGRAFPTPPRPSWTAASQAEPVRGVLWGHLKDRGEKSKSVGAVVGASGTLQEGS